MPVTPARPSPPRDTALLFTPVLPSPTGSGSAMRISMVVEELAGRFHLIVVHLPLWGDRPGVFDRGWVHRHARSVLRITPASLAALPPTVEAALAAAGTAGRLRLIYAFRLVVAPMALGCTRFDRDSRPLTLLDLDDDECARDGECARLEEMVGNRERAGQLRAERERMERFRLTLMQRFDHILLANPNDSRALAERHPTLSFRHLPNCVRAPREPVPSSQRDRRRMLFLGTLDYLPNEDAVRWFVADILSRIQAHDSSMGLRVVGVGLPARLLALGGTPGLALVGAVPDTAPELAAAGMLVVPLRAGSGTRIKILEAFQHGTPVVTTSKGAEGLAVRHGEHLLVADHPQDFAAACLSLAADRELADSLRAAAHHWVQDRHGPTALRSALRGVLATETHARPCSRSHDPERPDCASHR